MMTKRDFELIAATIKEVAQSMDDRQGVIASAFAYSLRNTSSRFNRGQFIEACMWIKEDGTKPD